MLQTIDVSQPSKSIKEQLLKASTEQGFLYVKGHGISQELIDKIFALSKSFFSLEEPLKTKYAIKDNIGYTSLSQEQLDIKKSKDYKEAYNFGKINCNTGDFPKDLHPAIFQQNYKIVQETNKLLYCVAQKLFFHLLSALEIDEATIDSQKDCFDGETNTVLRFLKYPNIRDVKESLNNDIRAGAHTDYGLMAMLFQQKGQEGLQLDINDNDEWVSVPYMPSDNPDIEGAPLVINFGDMLQFWTNDLIKSTTHRVVVPETRFKDRYSIVCFVHPVIETSLRAWKSKYINHSSESITSLNAGEYLLKRLKETYK
ncbi:hypothetical protein QEN19_001275 [Hanseniaspora menglaensis]